MEDDGKMMGKGGGGGGDDGEGWERGKNNLEHSIMV